MVQNYQKASQRGVPSLVWRAGQERRLAMIKASAGPRLGPKQRVLVNGCGVGLYNRALFKSTPHVYGLDIEADHVLQAAQVVPLLVIATGENLPYGDDQFDLVLSHEVIEHVADDRLYASEIVRVLRPGGRAVIFCPNRLYPFETHGHYWRGIYHFGNTPLINYLPDGWRNKLAPHVRAYTKGDLQRLFAYAPVQIVTHTQIYPGYDNLRSRYPGLGRLLQSVSYTLKQTPLRLFGLSHLLMNKKREAN